MAAPRTARPHAKATPAAALVALVALAGAACDRGDGRQLADPPTTTSVAPPTGTAGDGTRTFTAGEGLIDVQGVTSLSFAVSLCTVVSPDQPAEAPRPVTLQAEGAGTTSEGEPFTVSAVQAHPAVGGDTITETIRISFGSGTGLPDRAWEAQRVIDGPTGEVTDQYGEGTTRLFTVSTLDDGIEIAAVDAALWQFSFEPDEGDGGDGDRLIGAADMRITCR